MSDAGLIDDEVSSWLTALMARAPSSVSYGRFRSKPLRAAIAKGRKTFGDARLDRGLGALLKTGDSSERAAAAEALALNGEASLPLLRAAFQEALATKGPSTTDVLLQRDLCCALGDLGATAASAAAELERALASDDFGVRMSAATALVWIGPVAGPSLVRAVAVALSDPDRRVTTAVAATLRYHPDAARASMRAAVDAYPELDPGTLEALLEAVSACGGADAQAFAALASAHPRLAIRRKALAAAKQARAKK